MDRNFQPNLINLDTWSSELKWCMKEGRFPRAVPNIPECPFIGGWSKEEMDAMKENRKKAKIIYDAVVYVTK